MIGWRQILLTVLGAAFIVVVGFDRAGPLHDVLSHIVMFLSHLSVLDWVLVAFAWYAVWWAWARAIAFARPGPIVIDDLGTDDRSLSPIAAKAELQEQLARRGEIRPSGVPSGSPTVASIAAALTAAPIPQANWLGTLIAVIPTPPMSTGFRLSGALRKEEFDGQEVRYGLTYQLECSRPRPSVTIAEVWESDMKALLETASIEIFRSIAKAAPDIYPRWSLWSSSDALVRYRDGLAREQREAAAAGAPNRPGERERYRNALESYLGARELDPGNMLVRLRIANCLERTAQGLDEDARLSTQMDALLQYMAVRVREPTIFEAGYRASVLLSGLAKNADRIRRDQRDLLQYLLMRARDQDIRTAGVIARWITVRMPWWKAPQSDRGLEEVHFDRAARAELRLARLRLGAVSPIVNEGRLRHRFEPKGRARRQLRKALGIYAVAIRARRAGRREARGKRPPGRAVQVVWIIWVRLRYMLGRSRIAGWQSHYNAACCYALVPVAGQSGSIGRIVRRRALRHLDRAIDQAGPGDMPIAYVRDEDPDLTVLRKLDNDRFQQIVRRLRQDELTLRYERPDAKPEWELEVSGDAAVQASLKPIRATASEAVYRIRIVDETKLLSMRLEEGNWELVPAEFDASQAWVHPGDTDVHKRNGM
jgi:hypothetical protein